ncbi:hypothetical protein JGH11_00520 [Dysgonomonas sp. Marseille-P4677]|uniref:hypothetical protein n=1 Tax=Dysgonomonas sp. Marseille-P4677 TaxID=2364790 RepID=UPI0019140D6A|nr:hypothetical protein [Dysgonomonas sp. Marseille-P4677]MBK5719342.1 hypothetical protein [Dysgonomonas sp. Marseille-P4677]
MKTKKYLSLLLVLLFFLSGCSDDDKFTDVDGLPPTIVLGSSNIKTEPGRKFIVKATIEDKDGLQSINLKNAAFQLDKTIDFTLADTVTYLFSLNYEFQAPGDLVDDRYDLDITVTDLGGRSVKETVLVTMDGDFTNPIFTVAPDEAVTVLLKAETRLNVKFTVEDDKALNLVTIKIPELNYTKEITSFSNSGKTLEFNDPIALPSAVATYNLTILAQDKSGLTAEKNSVITVSEMPDFSKMYLIDVTNASQLNSDIFGIPMLIEHTGAYTYKARYYSEVAGTEIRFAPQKTDFSPICFGKDPVNNNVLTDDPDVSLPIVLPAKGYYEIVFNVKSGEYSVESYVPTDTPVAIGSPMYLNASDLAAGTIPLQIGLVGSGVPDSGNWNPAEPLILKQNSENKFLFSVEMTLEAGKDIEFIIQTQHSWGWWPEPFWRWERGEDPEMNIANGGENPAKWKVKTSGKYIFKFDSHLKRSKFYPIN